MRFVRGRKLANVVVAANAAVATAFGQAAAVTAGVDALVLMSKATAIASGRAASVASGSPVSAAVTATAANISSYLVRVTWTAGTNMPTDYRVEWSPAGANTWTEESLSAACKSTTRCVYFPSSPSTSYDFRVRVVNAGGFSAYSNVVTGATLARLAATNAVTVSAYGWTGDGGTNEDPATASAYSAGTAYVTGNVVTNGGSAYIALTETTGNAPPNATYWRPVATTVYYISSSAGNDANNGTSSATPWATVKKIRTKVTNAYLSGGAAPTNTLFLLKRGDVFDDVLYVQTSAGTNYSFGSYGVGAMPRIKWDTYDAAWQTRPGVVVFLTGSTLVKHIAIECGNTAAAGINTINSSAADQAMILHTCEIRGAKITGIRGDACSNWIVKNSWIVSNNSAGANGLDWSGHQFIGNTWDSNGQSHTLDHHLYISTASRLTIRGNNFINGTGNYGTNVHGASSEIIVDQNRYSGNNNGIGFSNGYIAGISLQSPKEMFAGCQITRNVIEDSGYGAGQAQGYGMILDSVVDLLVANNTFRNSKFTDITISASANPADDLPVSNVEVSNNSFASTSGVGSCLSVSSASTTGIRFRNNAMHLTAANGSAVTVATGVTAAEVTLTNNQYYAPAGSTDMFSWLGVNYISLAAFKAGVSGKEANSAEADPLFVNTTGNFALQGGSPCKNTGTPVASITIDFAGTARSGSTPSMGAYE